MTKIRPILLVALVVFAWTSAGAVTSQDVLKLMESNYQAVRDYQADVTLTVKGPNISIKGMRMTLLYKQPGKTKIIAKEGLGFMPKQMVFQATVQDMARHSKLTYLGEESKNGAACYAIKAEPKAAPPPKLPPGMRPPPPQPQESVKMWIDKRTGSVMGTSIQSSLGGGYEASVVSDWKHELVNNKYYMPAEISLEAKTSYRGGENMTVTVRFSNYKINQGIPDSAFKEASAPQPGFRHRHGRPPGPPPPAPQRPAKGGGK